MTARYIAEGVYLEEPSSSIMVSAADGTVLSCLAAPLLCSYLAERGHASEAWKLVGKAICAATAIGMHQDPGWPYWQVMSEEEQLLRRRAWWGLFIWDRLVSERLSLSRPLKLYVTDYILTFWDDPIYFARIFPTWNIPLTMRSGLKIFFLSGKSP